MALSHDIISQFAKIVNSDKKQSTETTLYGTVVDENGHKPGDKYVDDSGEHEYVIGANGCKYIKPDGSDQLIPITDMDEDPAKVKENSVANIDYGDRASVSIKNHTATVTGNISSPSTNNKEVNKQINEFDIAVGDQIQAKKAYFEKLTADKADIGKLAAAIISVAELIADDATIEELTAENAKITNLNAKKIDADVVIADSAIIEHLKASTIDVLSLIADIAAIKKLMAEDASITFLDAVNANLKYANIDFANIGMAAIEKIFSDSGIIKDLRTDTGYITGELVGVTIKGDLIEGNTIKADKLVVRGEDGVYYKLNVDGLDNISTTQASKFTLLNIKPDNWETNYKDYYIISDNKYIHITDNNAPTWQDNTYYKLNSNYESGLDGTVIVAHSITAEKISVSDLVAFGATIGGFHITDHSIYSGVKESIDNTTRGVYMDTDGQFAVGDANNFIKFYGEEHYKEFIEKSASGSVISVNDVNAIEHNLKVTLSSKNLATAQQVYEGNTLYAVMEYDGRTAVRFLDNKTVNWQGIEFKPNTQYTVSFDVRVVEREVKDGNSGLFYFKYSDGTVTRISAPRNDVWTHYTLTSTAGKTVVSVGTNSSNYVNYNYIDVNSFQLEEGATETAYTPYMTEFGEKIICEGETAVIESGGTVLTNFPLLSGQVNFSFDVTEGEISDIPLLQKGQDGLTAVANATINKSENHYTGLVEVPNDDEEYYLAMLPSEGDVNVTNLTISVNKTVSRYGKNLIPYPYSDIGSGESKTIRGITFTDNGDGTITVNGTATAQVQIQLYGEPIYFNGSYTLSGTPEGATGKAYLLCGFKKEEDASYGYNAVVRTEGFNKLWNNEKMVVYLRVLSGATVENLVFKPQFEKGRATEYEVPIEPQSATANSDGTVEGLTSTSPNMTLMTDTSGVIINLTYTSNESPEEPEIIYKLAIAAESLIFSASGKNAEELINEKTDFDDLDSAKDDVNKAMNDHVKVLTENADSLAASVNELDKSTKDSLNDLNDNMTTLRTELDLKVTPENLQIEIEKAVTNGASKVVTSTGFTFDDEGMTVDKKDPDGNSVSPTNTKVTENGMTVNSNVTKQAVLTANKDGVEAVNLHAREYLIVGKQGGRSRFEDYLNNRTACFWIGE